MAHTVVGGKEIGIALFGPYVLAVELASMLLLAGLGGAYHLARENTREINRYDEMNNKEGERN